MRANAASSIYHSLQTSLDKRLSKGVSFGVHSWSSFIDTASEIFDPSSGEVAVSQDSYNRNADRARSTYDRPHRFAGNFVYELPWYQNQDGFMGHVLGGWQASPTRVLILASAPAGSDPFKHGERRAALEGEEPV